MNAKQAMDAKLKGTTEERFRSGMVYGHVWKTCLNCENWSEITSGCSKAGGALPPPEIIVLGCDSWVADVPF